MDVKKTIGRVLSGLSLVGVLAMAACGSNSAPAYANDPMVPVAYGESGHCYYVDDPYEAQQLLAAGLCPAGWTPYPMPVYWHARYYRYYDNPYYANTYVIPIHRTVYVKQQTTVFEKQQATTIKQQTSQAQYKDTKTGKTYTGTQVSKIKQPKFSGGNAPVNTGGNGSTVKQPTAGSYVPPATNTVPKTNTVPAAPATVKQYTPPVAKYTPQQRPTKRRR